MDSVNNRFGDLTLTWGSLLNLEDRSKIISPAWRPEGPRKIEF
jgi:DNA polymerase-4